MNGTPPKRLRWSPPLRATGMPFGEVTSAPPVGNACANVLSVSRMPVARNGGLQRVNPDVLQAVAMSWLRVL